MTADTEGTPKGLRYTIIHEAWYRHVTESIEIVVGRYDPDGGCYWEFTVRKVGDIGVRVDVFDDAWAAFTEIPEFFARLAAIGRRATLDDVRGILDGLGSQDATQRTREG